MGKERLLEMGRFLKGTKLWPGNRHSSHRKERTQTTTSTADTSPQKCLITQIK